MAIIASGATNLTAGDDINLSSTSNNFGGAVSASGNDIALGDSNGITLGSTTSTGNYSVNAGGDITQSGPLIVAGTSNFSTLADITLLNQLNAFTGAISASGNDIQIYNSLATILGTITATGNSSDPASLSVTAANGDITATGTITSEDLTLTATTGDITQSGSGTIIASGATNLTAGDDINLSSTSNNFGGAVSASGNDIALGDSNGITLGSTTSTGNFSVNAGGDITQSGPLTVAGTSNFSTSADITLLNQLNAFTGAISASGNDIQIYNSLATILGNIDIGGTFSLMSNGDVSQAAGSALDIAGISSFTTTGNVNLSSPNNDFGAPVSLQAYSAFIIDANSLVLGDVNVSGNLKLRAADSITRGGIFNVRGRVSERTQSLSANDLSDAEITQLINELIPISASVQSNAGASSAQGTGAAANPGAPFGAPAPGGSAKMIGREATTDQGGGTIGLVAVQDVNSYQWDATKIGLAIEIAEPKIEVTANTNDNGNVFVSAYPLRPETKAAEAAGTQQQIGPGASSDTANGATAPAGTSERTGAVLVEPSGNLRTTGDGTAQNQTAENITPLNTKEGLRESDERPDQNVVPSFLRTIRQRFEERQRLARQASLYTKNKQDVIATENKGLEP
jgi:hypothetical protein